MRQTPMRQPPSPGPSGPRPLLRALRLGQRLQAAAGGLALALALCAPLRAEEIAVADRDGLLAAMGRATRGDVIRLADGNYGEVIFQRSPNGVTFEAAAPGGAVLDKLSMQNVADLAFRGIEVRGEFRAQRSKGIEIHEVKARQFYFRDVDGLLIDRSEGAHGHFNLILNSIQNFSVTNSYFHGAAEDVCRITGNSYNGLIENNRFHDTVAKRPTHPDLMQIFHAKGIAPRDLVIRGNHFWDDQTTGDVRAQGPFLNAPGKTGFRNILIEENLIAVPHANTIYVNGGQENVVIRNNTLIFIPGSTMPNAIIRLAQVSGYDNSGTIIEGNILRGINDETKSSTIGDNYLYGKGARMAALFSGPGARWQDFMPVTGSPIDFGSPYGAQARLKELLASIKPPRPNP